MLSMNLTFQHKMGAILCVYLNPYLKYIRYKIN